MSFINDIQEATNLGTVTIVMIAMLIFGIGTATLTFDRWAKPFRAETTYIANKQSSMARDGAINKLTTLHTNYARVAAADSTGPVIEGLKQRAITEYNGMAHKADVPEYLNDWLETLQPGITK